MRWAPHVRRAWRRDDEATIMLEVGAQMPDFTLRNTQREVVTQDDFAGSIAVLAFYPMAFTGG